MGDVHTNVGVCRSVVIDHHHHHQHPAAAATSSATTPFLRCPLLAVHTSNKGSLEEGIGMMEGWRAVTTGAFEREEVS